MTRRTGRARQRNDLELQAPPNPKDHFESFYERHLQPYDDNLFLIDQLTGDSRTLRRHPELRETIHLALLCDDDASLQEAGTELEEVAIREPLLRSIPARTLDYLRFVQQLDRIKADCVGFEAPSDRSNFLMHVGLDSFTRNMPVETLKEQHFTNLYLAERLRTLGEEGFVSLDGYGYLSTKLAHLASNTEIALDNSNYFEFGASEPDSREYDHDEIERDSKYTARLFQSIHDSRDYGMKLGYFTHEMGGSLVYNDLANMIIDELNNKSEGNHKNVHPLSVAQKRRVVFDVAHSAYSDPSFSKPKYIYNRDVHGQAASSQIAYTNLNPLLMTYVGQNGELYSDLSCRRPLVYDAAAHGRYEQYRRLQATIFAEYFDLTHSSAIEDTNEGITLPHIPSAYVAGQPIEVFRELVVPRIARQDARQHAETEEASNEPSVKFHDVTYFRRKLPAGAKASPEAQRLAAEHGIDLPEGKTFVRAHSRGSKRLGEVIAHRFVTLQP